MNIIEQFIIPNKYTRPQIQLTSVQKIVIHWISQTSSAQNNIIYCSTMPTNPNPRYCGFQSVIDKDGTIYKTMPFGEKTYGCGTADYNNYTKLGKQLYDDFGSPNNVTFNIELCHPDMTGKPTVETYKGIVEYVAYLCNVFTLDPFNDVVLHSDIVSTSVKPPCHKWFYSNPSKWNSFKNEVSTLMSSNDYQNSWEQQNGEEAIDSLVQHGIINTPEMWKSKNLRDTPAPLWLFFVELDRVMNEVKK